MTDRSNAASSAAGDRGGHPIRGAIFGLLFGLFLTLDLALLGTLPIDSVLLYVVPVLGLIAGAGLGSWAPVRPTRR